MTAHKPTPEEKLKTIYVESDDEIADLCEVFATTKEPRLCLVFPMRSPLLLSKINIKLLLQKAREYHKTLLCATKDPIGRKHLKDLGVELQELAHAEENRPAPAASEMEKSVSAIHESPLPAWQQWVRDRIPASWGKLPALPKLPKRTSTTRYELRLNKPGKKLIFALLFLSVGLFLFIGYIAIPGATVYIDPQVASQTRSLNIIFADPNKNDPNSFAERTVALYPLDLNFEREVTIGSTGQNFFGDFAKGTVTVFNNDSKMRPIVATSRLQTPEGLLFLTDSNIEVPPKTAQGPGSAVVTVTAAAEDAYGGIIGEKGNIGPSTFHFPGLSKESQEIVWAESKEAFSGGTTEVEKFVKDEDVEAARKKVEQELKYVAVTELNNRLAEINQEQGTHYVLFDKLDRQERIIQKDVLDITVPKVAGQKLVSFQAVGKMRTRGWYYDQQEVYDIMKKHMEERLSPTENLLKIDERTMKFTTLFEDELDMNRGIIKATASIEGIISYNFFDARTTLVRNIKQSIIGRSKFDAEKEINNLPQVRDVHIVTWPFWAPTLPTIQDNIEIVVREVE